MKADEYEEFLFDPTGFYLEKYLPRVAGAYQGLSDLAQLSQSYYIGVAHASSIFSRPHVMCAFDRLRNAGHETGEVFRHTGELVARLAAHGYPDIAGGGSQAPYDVLADYMRGAKNTMTDMYRRKDLVLAALDKLSTLVLKGTLAAARHSRSPIVVIPIHWGPDNFMSPGQFSTFFWPSLRKVMMGLIDAGLVPMPLWESVCTRRLEIIANVPKGKCIYWFEGTDLVNAKEVLGDTVALYGNVPASILTTGSPGEVDAAVRHLAENVFQRGGKLILGAGSPLPDETPIANARAMFEAARKYGA
jgi:uroporphyrinogen-III decarboxylase